MEVNRNINIQGVSVRVCIKSILLCLILIISHEYIHNPKLLLNGCIYTLTLDREATNKGEKLAEKKTSRLKVYDS